jgi:ribosome maturation protein Sdo1
MEVSIKTSHEALFLLVTDKLVLKGRWKKTHEQRLREREERPRDCRVVRWNRREHIQPPPRGPDPARGIQRLRHKGHWII